MRKEYKSGDIQYNFSEDVDKDLIEVNIFNPNVFDYDREIVIDKDGSLSELDLINQVSDMDYFEGIKIDELINDIRSDLQDHIRLNELQSSITVEIRDFEYDISNKTVPHTNFNIIFDDNTYNVDIPIYKKDDGNYSINDDNYGIAEIRDMLYQHSGLSDIAEIMSEKYGEEIARDTLQKVIIEADKCVASDTDLILEEQEQKQEKKQKKSKGFGMSM
jgi:hypothetical protein